MPVFCLIGKAFFEKARFYYVDRSAGRRRNGFTAASIGSKLGDTITNSVTTGRGRGRFLFSIDAKAQGLRGGFHWVRFRGNLTPDGVG